MIIGTIVLCLWGYWIYMVWSEVLSDLWSERGSNKDTSKSDIGRGFGEAIMLSFVYPPAIVLCFGIAIYNCSG